MTETASRFAARAWAKMRWKAPLCKRNSLPIKKMEVAHCKAVAFAGLCMSLPIKIWRFPGVFGGFEAPFGWLYGARIEFSLWKSLARCYAQR